MDGSFSRGGERNSNTEEEVLEKNNGPVLEKKDSKTSAL